MLKFLENKDFSAISPLAEMRKFCFGEMSPPGWEVEVPRAMLWEGSMWRRR